MFFPKAVGNNVFMGDFQLLFLFASCFSGSAIHMLHFNKTTIYGGSLFEHFGLVVVVQLKLRE